MDHVLSIIRPLSPEDEPFLWEMLYQALYVPEGGEPFPRDTVYQPQTRRYVQNWGLADDIGVIAIEDRHKPIGAAWVRLLTGENKGYGYVDDLTPELTIAVLPEYRHCGIGTRLLLQLFAIVESHYAVISLSVAAENPAVRLYQRFSFQVVGSCGGSMKMVKKLNSKKYI